MAAVISSSSAFHTPHSRHFLSPHAIVHRPHNDVQPAHHNGFEAFAMHHHGHHPHTRTPSPASNSSSWREHGPVPLIEQPRTTSRSPSHSRKSSEQWRSPSREHRVTPAATAVPKDSIPSTHAPGVYSASDLLRLATSPLVGVSAESQAVLEDLVAHNVWRRGPHTETRKSGSRSRRASPRRSASSESEEGIHCNTTIIQTKHWRGDLWHEPRSAGERDCGESKSDAPQSAALVSTVVVQVWSRSGPGPSRVLSTGRVAADSVRTASGTVDRGEGKVWERDFTLRHSVGWMILDRCLSIARPLRRRLSRRSVPFRVCRARRPIHHQEQSMLSTPRSRSAVQELMIPTQPPAKRKASEDSNSTAKRSRKDNAASNKRKFVSSSVANGEEQPGGLVIIRSVPSHPPSSQGVKPPSSSQSSTPDPTTSRVPPSQPPNKKFKASSSGTSTSNKTGKGKERDLSASSRPEVEVDEDVRRMETETDALRRASRPHTGSSSMSLDFTRETNHSRQSSHIDSSLPLAPRETPQIEKNKIMRGESGHVRRSSLTSRGKRTSTSFENTGVITQPHPSVENASLYKHIDRDLPEPSRARQLLIWCAARTSAVPPSITSDEERKVLNGLEDDAVSMLAKKQIDTNVYSLAGSESDVPRNVSNEQNVKNRARKVKFSGEINRAKAEHEAWIQLEQFYRELDHRWQPSVKGKGKQRDVGEEDWGPREAELSEQFRTGVDLVRSVLAVDSAQSSTLGQHIADLSYRIDRWHALVNTSMQTASVSQTDLDRRFDLLTHTLHARSQPSVPSSSSTSLAAYLPLPTRTKDPQELFRALTRVDMERPLAQVGDAAQRAVREVQRAQAGEGPGDRRLTSVAPPTPRKPPGTPRRGATPGRGK
ncbi:hypothetical protein BV25DRAFT_1840796 [Artomyces pyxidatus]|uniref:Uncharacterized protein n=1 Tax=Artomyces pyxidatus TaxID=48021 RepID=A0ACB8SQA5_9AGAM|nr:hypothetical protein BV25DRAFT_1840796 [Artomyces pyxidatus]